MEQNCFLRYAVLVVGDNHKINQGPIKCKKGSELIKVNDVRKEYPIPYNTCGIYSNQATCPPNKAIGQYSRL